MAPLIRRSRLALQTDSTCKLGAVSLSGFVRNGRGISLVHRRTYGRYALVYLLEGSGRMRSGALPVTPCRAGDLLFVFPDIPQGYGPGPGETWSEFYVVFSGPVFDLWRRSGLLQPQNPIRRLGHIRRWLPQLVAVTDPALPNTAEGMLKRVCRLQKFLSDIAEVSEAAPQPWVERAMRLLVDAPGISPEEVADSLSISYETFRKEFARQVGQPPGRYRVHRLIEQARLLMMERNLNNKQIAETLGFYDEFHFSKKFQQVTGESTRSFRAKQGRG